MTFAGGPSLVGTAALLGYAKRVFEANERTPSKGWTALAAGSVLALWMLVFVGWSAPTVLRSWTAHGVPEVSLVLLSATWVAAIGLVGLLLVRSRAAARYLTEAYRGSEGPWLVRVFRRVLA